jgi:peptidylprolyl isomerase
MPKQSVANAVANAKVSDDNKLHIEDLKKGSGDREVQGGDYVVMHYKGTLLDGTEFDSSYKRGKPFKTRIGVGQVIEGWDMGVPGMKVGGKRKLIIPAKLAYGDRDLDVIPANSTLVFEMELVEIE